MTASCALWIFQAGCFGGELTTGSLPEWMTAIVTVLALAAAVYAGIAATSAARSAREQSAAATGALVAAQKQAEAASEALSHSRQQAQAALDSVKHSEAAAESAQEQAGLARLAFEADAKVREEAQARLVYSDIVEWGYVAKNKELTGEDKHWERTVWDADALSPWKEHDSTGLPIRNRKTTRDAVKVGVKVYNKSAEIIAPVRLYLIQPETPNRSKADQFTEIIAPGEEQTYFVVVPMSPETNIYNTTPQAILASWVQVIEFRDSSGVWWSRTGSEPIAKLVI